MAKNEFDKLMSVGIDICKDVFHLVGFDRDGQRVLGKKIKRMALIPDTGMSPAHLTCLCAGRLVPVKSGPNASSQVGSRGYLPHQWTCVSPRTCRAFEGDVRD